MNDSTLSSPCYCPAPWRNARLSRSFSLSISFKSPLDRRKTGARVRAARARFPAGKVKLALIRATRKIQYFVGKQSGDASAACTSIRFRT